MKVRSKLLKYLGFGHAQPMKTSPPGPASTFSTTLLNLRRELDDLYGTSWSQDNPDSAARLIQAVAQHRQAKVLEDLRDMLANGTGALTIGIATGGHE